MDFTYYYVSKLFSNNFNIEFYIFIFHSIQILDIKGS